MKDRVFNIDADLGQSHGAYLCDRRTGAEFLDFHGMFSSIPLGYNHPIFGSRFWDQLRAIAHIKTANAVVHTQEYWDFQEAFAPHCFSEALHFTCTGSTAVEAAIKCALEHHQDPKGQVISLRHSFHGMNGWGFATDPCFHSRERLGYNPPSPWIKETIEELRHRLKRGNTEHVVAVLVEPVLCTAGDEYLAPEILREVRQLCRHHKICFIVDEIQTGFGTTGDFWYSEKIDLHPDILIFGKKAQVSGIIARGPYQHCLKSPEKKLVVTYNGDLIDMLRATYILKAYQEDGLVEKAKPNSNFFRETLDSRVENFRSQGHLVAFDFGSSHQRDRFVALGLQHGFLCNQSGERTIRLRPPLALCSAERQHFASIMDKVFRRL